LRRQRLDDLLGNAARRNGVAKVADVAAAAVEDRFEVLVAGVGLLMPGDDPRRSEALDKIDALDPVWR
jgi:hypothetical protein